MKLIFSCLALNFLEDLDLLFKSYRLYYLHSSEHPFLRISILIPIVVICWIQLSFRVYLSKLICNKLFHEGEPALSKHQLLTVLLTRLRVMSIMYHKQSAHLSRMLHQFFENLEYNTQGCIKLRNISIKF